MISVPVQERQLTFRNVTPTDKFTKRNHLSQQGDLMKDMFTAARARMRGMATRQ